MFKAHYTLFLLLLVGPLLAQQQTSWSRYRAFPFLFNPAMAEHLEADGGGNSLDVDLGFRQQWSAFEDAPQTMLAGAQYSHDRLNMNLGLFLLRDEFGPSGFTQAQVSYAYRLRLSRFKDHGLAIGIGLSMTQFRLDGSILEVENESDPLVGEMLQSQSFPNAAAGLYYYNEIAGGSRPVYLMMGAAADQALPYQLNFEGKGSRQASLQREIHYNAFMGMRSYYGGGYDYLEVHAMVRKVFYAPLNVIGGVRISFADQAFSVGAALSSAWEAHLQTGFNLFDEWTIGYAASFYLSNTFEAPAGVTHELGLSGTLWW